MAVTLPLEAIHRPQWALCLYTYLDRTGPCDGPADWWVVDHREYADRKPDGPYCRVHAQRVVEEASKLP